MNSTKKQVDIVLESLISKCEQSGYILGIDVEIIAIFTHFAKYDLSKFKKRYNNLPKEYAERRLESDIKEYDLAYEYALISL